MITFTITLLVIASAMNASSTNAVKIDAADINLDDFDKIWYVPNNRGLPITEPMSLEIAQMSMRWAKIMAEAGLSRPKNYDNGEFNNNKDNKMADCVYLSYENN